VLAVSTAWIGVIGALGGVVVTGLIGLVTALLNHRWQEANRRAVRRERVSEGRAELRRGAYVRFLVAAQAMGDFLLTTRPDPGVDVVEAWRSLRVTQPEKFEEFDASERAVRILAGREVVEALDAYRSWFDDETIVAINSENPVAEAFNGWEEAEGKLIDALRHEQEADLTASA
jgi:hypothetical protein